MESETGNRAKSWVSAALMILALMLPLLAGAPTESLAQESPETDSNLEVVDPADQWNETAARALEALRSGKASSSAFEVLRQKLADERDQALAIAESGSILSKSVQAQIDALGAAPDGDGSERADIAARRAELNASLAVADAPVIAAREAFNRANVLISEIDSVIRARESVELTTLLPTPINPFNWAGAFAEMQDYLGRVLVEFEKSIANPSKATPLKIRLIAAGLLLVLSLAVVFIILPVTLRSMNARARRVDAKTTHSGWGLLAVLARLVLASLAGILAYSAFSTLDISSTAARSLIRVVPAIGAFLVVSYWLGYVIFAPDAPERRLMKLPDHQARTGFWIVMGVGLVLVVELAIEASEKDMTFLPGTHAVASVFALLPGAFLLWVFGSMAQRSTKAQTESDSIEDPSYTAALVQLLARTLQVLAIAIVVLTLSGFTALARFVLSGCALSLGVIGILLATDKLIVSALGLAAGVSGREHDETRQSFLSIAIGLTMSIAALPVIALIWGARPADISEFWRLMTEGVVVGGTRLSATVVLVFAFTLLAGLVASRWLQRFLGSAVLPRTHLDSGAQSALRTGIGYLGATVSLMLAVGFAGIDLSSLAIVFGALSVGLGFGLQAVVSNFICGIILLIERPFKEGDWIEVSGYSGIVRKISVRFTRLETFDRDDVIVPNTDLITGTVKNMTLSTITGRVIVPVGIAYGSDIEKAESIFVDIMSAHPDVLREPAPAVLFRGLGDSALDFELRCFISNVGLGLTVRSDLLAGVYRELDKAGIEIPFPQRDLHIRTSSGPTDLSAQNPSEAEPTTSPQPG
ncbi:MAG: DUF3772 domain-containing protein [Hoeflea sp.]|uniref:DUF3772 domain-containing protein n=1 Tax=Hoeflea sp. TaxID=1940281 RepID=UPI0032EE53E9